MPSQWICSRISRLMTAVRRGFAPISFSLLVGAAAMLAAVIPARPVSAQGTVPSLPAAPAWIEPRGLSIVDMVGQVPEDQLVDAILVYETGTGLVQYVSGSRSGNTVVIDTRMTPRYGATWTQIGCLAQPAAGDQWPTTVPASTVQILANGKDITSRIYAIQYTPAGLGEPQTGSGAYLRYARSASVNTGGASPARVPANGGCAIIIDGKHANITARFTIVTSPQVSVTPMGSVTFQAHSYIGVGGRGVLGSLVDQMLRRFGERHDAFDLNVPAGADYMFVKYAPTAFDPYAAEYELNYNLPGSGTYRFEIFGPGRLSVDHVNSMGIPTWGSWNDADLSDSSFLGAANFRGRIKTPEYFLPPGIPFDQCMVSGGCSTALLDAIYNQSFPVQVYFYKVERLAGTNLLRVPLKMVGKSWRPSAASAAGMTDGPFAIAQVQYAVDALATMAPAESLQQPPVFLPIVGKSNPPAPPAPLPPGDPTGCPCGWFDAQGQMYDFIPPQ